MGRFFSARVERALKCIYYDLRGGQGQEGFRLLQQAVQDGDADACCLLARCLYGPEYTWPGHNFPIDEQAGDELMRHSVLGGSAIGALLSLRSGVMDRQLAQAMPLSLQEAFDIVLDKAEHGEPLCQMIVGNVYFWGDFVQVQGKAREDFDSDDAIQSFLRENYAKCEDWLWRAYRNGVSLANLNYDGKGVERDYAKAFQLLKWAEDNGAAPQFYYLGACYANGQGTQQDYAKALKYLEQIDWHCPAGFYLLSYTATAWASLRTSPRGWDISRKLATMPAPRKN